MQHGLSGLARWQDAFDNRLPPDDLPDTRVADGEAFWEALAAGRNLSLPMGDGGSEHIGALLQSQTLGTEDLLFAACHLAAAKVLPELQHEQDARAGAALRAFAEAVCNAYAEAKWEAM